MKLILAHTLGLFGLSAVNYDSARFIGQQEAISNAKNCVRVSRVFWVSSPIAQPSPPVSKTFGSVVRAGPTARPIPPTICARLVPSLTIPLGVKIAFPHADSYNLELKS
jgi:hypothetical protein